MASREILAHLNRRPAAPSSCKTSPEAKDRDQWQYHRPAADYQLTITAWMYFVLEVGPSLSRGRGRGRGPRRQEYINDADLSSRLARLFRVTRREGQARWSRSAAPCTHRARARPAAPDRSALLPLSDWSEWPGERAVELKECQGRVLHS